MRSLLSFLSSTRPGSGGAAGGFSGVALLEMFRTEMLVMLAFKAGSVKTKKKHVFD